MFCHDPKTGRINWLQKLRKRTEPKGELQLHHHCLLLTKVFSKGYMQDPTPSPEPDLAQEFAEPESSPELATGRVVNNDELAWMRD